MLSPHQTGQLLPQMQTGNLQLMRHDQGSVFNRSCIIVKVDAGASNSRIESGHAIDSAYSSDIP